MFIITRVIEVEKGVSESFIQVFHNQKLVEKTIGFIKKEVLINDQNPNFDTLRLSVYFKDKNDFIAWEKSPEHLALHQNKSKEKPKGALSFKLEHYQSK